MALARKVWNVLGGEEKNNNNSKKTKTKESERTGVSDYEYKWCRSIMRNELLIQQKKKK